VRAYRINKYLHQLIRPEFHARFLADTDATYEEAGLSVIERKMVTQRDWKTRIHHGVIFFLLEQLGAVIGQRIVTYPNQEEKLTKLDMLWYNRIK
jgi:gallate dioxygenase